MMNAEAFATAVCSSTTTDDWKRRKLDEQTWSRAEVIKKKSVIYPTYSSLKVNCDFQEDPLNLFVLGVDLLPLLISFLELAEVVQCEMTCKNLQKLTKQYWIERDRCINSDLESSSTQSHTESSVIEARRRVVHWCLASRLAERVEPLISCHLRVRWNRGDCKGCDDFPNEISDYGTICNNPDQYEIFLRLSKKGKLLFQGFISHHTSLQAGDFRVIYIQPRHLGMLEWPPGHCESPEWCEPMKEMMDNLSVTLVAVQKANYEVGLLAALEHFCDHSIEDPSIFVFWRRSFYVDTRPHDGWSYSSQRRSIKLVWHYNESRDRRFGITICQ